MNRRRFLRSTLLSGVVFSLRRLRFAQTLLPTARGTPLFTDGFDAPTLGVKPSFSIMADVEDGYRWMHTPSIIEGQNGVLLAGWSSNGPHGDEDPTNYIEIVRSLDGGATWSRPNAATPPSAVNPVFLRAANGDPVLFYMFNHSPRQDDGSIVFRRTRDNGLTWSEPTAVDIGATVAIMVNNGITLPDGSWMISLHYDHAQQGEHFSVDNADYVACVAVSRDEGRTWTRHDAARIPNESHNPNDKSWAVEPSLALTRDGLLRMVIRTRNGWLYQTTSRDLGHTWEPVAKMGYSNDDAKPSIVELEKGRELLLWNDTRLLDFPLRFPLMATLSEDDGRTWFRSVTLEDTAVALDYPSAIQVGDSIKLVYGYDRRQMRFVNLHLTDFKPWVPINDAGSWCIADGVLQFAGERGSVVTPNLPNWLQSSKVVAFLPVRPGTSIVSLDLRFDEVPPRDAMLGLFAAYQDEANWTAWVWRPGANVAGLEQQSHAGSLAHPWHATNASNFFLDRVVAPQLHTWYTVDVALTPGSARYRLTEKASGRLVLAGSAAIDWQGRFLALGVRKTAASFDNVVVR